jgi:hypothetical protein
MRRSLLLVLALLVAGAVASSVSSTSDLESSKLVVVLEDADASLEVLAQNNSVSSSVDDKWTLWLGSGKRGAVKPKEQTLAELRAENDWKNELFLFWWPAEMREPIPRVVQVCGRGGKLVFWAGNHWKQAGTRAVCAHRGAPDSPSRPHHPSPLSRVLWMQSWMRNYIASNALYLISGLIWVYFEYFCFGTQLYKPGTIPKARDIVEQIKVWVGLAAVGLWEL